MSEEDFVTYEQALALKKLGFREPCLYYYHNNALLPNDVYAKKVELLNYLKRYNVSDLSKVRNSAKEPTICDAPTLAQVDKWLRSKGMWVEICLEPFNEKGWEFDIFNLKDHYYYNFAFSTVYDTYEEALSAGITECIKIIEEKEI